jgi:phosphatidylglycerophosphate synthase
MAVRTEPREFRDATRILAGVLSQSERRVLVWIARRLPARVTSDHLTILGLVAMLGAGLSYWLASISPAGLPLVVVCLALNWFGDSLDGTLARVRGRERPRFGYYVDHIADAFGILFLAGGMGLSGYMTPAVAASFLIAYYLLSIEVYLAAHTVGEFRITYFSVGPTELRILLAAGTLTLLAKPHVVLFGRQFLLFDVAGGVAAAGLVATTILMAVKHTRQLGTGLFLGTGLVSTDLQQLGTGLGPVGARGDGRSPVSRPQPR